MLFRTLLYASALSFAIWTPCVAAGTVYDMTFTDQSTNQLLSDGTGTFIVNSTGTVTRFDLRFTVLKTFQEANVVYSPGDVLSFDTLNGTTSQGGPLPTYDPVHNAFNYGNRDYATTLISQPAADPNKGARLTFASNNGLGNGYLVSGLAYGEFYHAADNGVWSVTAAPPTAAPEPGCALLLLLGMGTVGCVFLRNPRSEAVR